MCRAWNVTICSLTPALIFFFSQSCPILSFLSLWLGLSQFPTCFCMWNTELWIGVCSIGYRLLNAYVFNVSAPQMPFFCVRKTLWFLFVKCGMFGLSASPFQWSWHCYGAQVLYCWPYSFLSWTWSTALLLNHCACEALCRKDCTTCLQTVGVWSLSPEQGWDEDAIHFCSL